MLDVVIKGIAIPNAFERKPSDSWDQLGQARMRGAKRAFHV
jgi:hypothetical protein